MSMRKIVPVLFAFASVLAGCGDDTAKPTPPATSASALAPSVAAESKTLVKMTIDPSGTAMFDMKAPLENIKGTVKGFGGTVEVELSDLTRSRGEITMDITTLETHTFGDEGKDQTQTKHALTWLEVGEKTEASKKDSFKTAKFAIREISGASEANVMKLTGDTRNVTLTAKGDFLLHGQSVSLTLDLSCAFMFEGDKLKGISIKSAKPATVNLKAHQVEARNDAGEAVIAKTLELFGKKVADDASVTFEVMARPEGEKGLMPAPATAAPTAAPTGSADAK
ncbi:MAG: YceI family protein [Polyangiaceae bacterium]